MVANTQQPLNSTLQADTLVGWLRPQAASMNGALISVPLLNRLVRSLGGSLQGCNNPACTLQAGIFDSLSRV